MGSDSRISSSLLMYVLRRHIGMSASVCMQNILEKVWAFTKYVAVSLVLHV